KPSMKYGILPSQSMAAMGGFSPESSSSPRQSIEDMGSRLEFQRQSVGAGEVVMDPVVSIANRTLEREAWARQKLAAHAGRTVRIRIGLAWTTLCVGPEGFFN